MANSPNPIELFIETACVPLHMGHGTGDLRIAEQILREHPETAAACIQTAAILGDATRVRTFLGGDPAKATAKGGPRDWDPLTYLCFSKYLRLDRARSADFVETARSLLDAGASATTGFFSNEHRPEPEFECVLYGAAGVAHHAELTRLLLERGADPNDGEVSYHSPEDDDNATVRALVESGRLTPDTLARMLLRKADWHDPAGVQLLLDAGADPNRMTGWGFTALHQAVRRDNALATVELMLHHGADPALPTNPTPRHLNHPETAVQIAAQRGRQDVLDLFARSGVPIRLDGVDGLTVACAANDAALVRSMSEREPHLVKELLANGGRLLAQFAGNGNVEGVRQLLDLGVDVRARFLEGDGYFGVARNSTEPLHVAAWRARHAVVRRLIEWNAPVDERDGNGRTPLALAVRACVDSHWTARRTPESVEALLQAGASIRGIPFPSGYAEVDALLQAHGASEE